MNEFPHDPFVLDEAYKLVSNINGSEIAKIVSNLSCENKKWRENECFNFLAAESPQSSFSLSALGSVIGKRAAGGGIGISNRFVRGTKYIDSIEAIYHELMKKLLSAKFVDYRPLGGVSANHIVYAAVSRPNDIVMSLSELNGGDPVHRKNGAPGVLGLRVKDIPFDKEKYEIDYDLLEERINKIKPNIISIGQSNCLFPVNYAKIKSLIKNINCTLVADAAHETGLICGKTHPNPLDQGADILIGTTGKTFSGPHGGIIAWNDDKWSKKIFYMSSPVYTGTHQVNRILASLISASELYKYGDEYMGTIKRNAYLFAQHLFKNGMKVVGKNNDFTQTHQVLFEVDNIGEAQEVAKKLEEVNLIVNTTSLPSKIRRASSGIRLGFTEISRLGPSEGQVRELADLFIESLLGNKPSFKIKKQVMSLRSNFKEYKFCHKQKDIYEGNKLT